jgi:Subtilase family
MDPVTSAQFLSMKASFSRQGIDIDVALTPTGAIDYIYAVGQLLAVDRDDNIERMEAMLPGLTRAQPDEQPEVGDLVLLSIGEAEGGNLTVPDAMELIDQRLVDNPALEGGEPWCTPVHVVHIAKICPAGEPEVPSGYPTEPWPPPSPAGESDNGGRVLVVDTGLLRDLDPAQYPWLAGVTGDDDLLHPPTLPGGPPNIPQYAGHGTFGAGVARCMAPGAPVYVGNHFTESGGELEHVIIRKLEQLIKDQAPDLVCLPAGTYTRENWVSLGFSEFRRRHPDIILVASAGNDSTDREFYPAAFPWAVGVGALGTDQQHRAWFSNFGRSAKVYALGEGIVNAYATGIYTYHEPPKQPAKQNFYGMATWEGTSFSAPLVAGLIAREMGTSGSTASAAAQTVLNNATVLPGVGPALFPP